MKKNRAIVFLIFFLFPLFSITAQNAAQSTAQDTAQGAAQDSENAGNPVDFFLIPVLETVFSGDVRWRPDWPQNIPPDSFYLLNEKKREQRMEISSDDLKLSVRRDGKGRLLEFPFFPGDGYAAVKASYAETGAVTRMSVSISKFSQQNDDANSDANNGADSSADNEGKTWEIFFPRDFLPYSDLSLGGSFPPVKAVSDDDVFLIFIFETQSYLTETWYSMPQSDASSEDGGGEAEMVVFCKALVEKENGWRVTSLQIHDERGVNFEDYYFDSDGNATELQIQDKKYSALYRDKRPVYWNRDSVQYELQWDTRGILNIVKTLEVPEDQYAEYRYEYERNSGGEWTKRKSAVYKSQYGLLSPQFGNEWNRRIGD